MVILRRVIRFCVNPGGEDGGGVNGYGGKPAMRGLGRHYELEVVCRGAPDHETGYLLNIKEIDAAAREAVLPTIVEACRNAPETEPATMMAVLATRVQRALAPTEVRGLLWRLTPTYSVEISIDEESPTMASVLMRQRFDFAAAHRLHLASFSDEENRRLFGRCNNPNGHGHNYQVEPCVELPEGGAFTLEDLEQLTHEHVLEAYDHTNLNEDTSDFAVGVGVNPSVENISRACFERLAPAIEERGARLRHVTVWETDRTSARYPG